jgi:ribosomal protein S15P/S13E
MATTKTETKIEKPVWLKYTKTEVKEIIISLAKKDPELSSEKIGLILRDSYGIPRVKIYQIKIGQVLREAGLYKNPDLKNLEKKQEKLKVHLEKNKQDKRTRRALTITFGKAKKTREYLIKRGEEKKIDKKEARKLRKKK